MGWFHKENEQPKKPQTLSLPELPKLPELPNMDEEEPIPQLPSFPNSSLGDKFSQNTIKEAVTGKKEGEREFDADDFVDEEEQMMPIPPKQTYTESNPYKIKSKTDEGEPIFVRIDKFEESLDIFEKTKDKIADIDETLKQIKETREKEEEQISVWEKEIQRVKEQIEKIDAELFSKI